MLKYSFLTTALTVLLLLLLLTALIKKDHILHKMSTTECDDLQTLFHFNVTEYSKKVQLDKPCLKYYNTQFEKTLKVFEEDVTMAACCSC